MDHSSMSNMGTLQQSDRDAWKHMNGAIFLDITPIFDHDTSPISPDGRPWPDIYVFTNDHLTSHGGHRMHKRGRIDDRDMVFKTVYHDFQAFSSPKLTNQSVPELVEGHN
jgi:hypothetical protein